MMRSVARVRHGARRRRQRGAILVEALVVTSVLITILALGVYLYGVYAAKYAALRDARLSAWTQVMAGCGAPPNAQALAPAAGSLGGEPQVSEDETLSWLLVEKRSSSAARRAQAVQAAALEAQTLNGHLTVMCNELTQDGKGVVGLVNYFAGNVMRLAR
jgi:hypothetical protein